jgi:hypothetical protein
MAGRYNVIMDRLALFEKLHLQEFARRDGFTSRLATPVGAIGAIFGALSYLLVYFKFGGTAFRYSALVEYAFLSFCCLSALAVLRGAYCVARVAMGQGYEYMPDPDLLRLHLDRLEQWHKSMGARNFKQAAESDFMDYLQAKFTKCASINWHKNRAQSELMYHGLLMTAIGLAFLVAALLCYYIDFRFDVLPRPAPSAGT